MRKLFSYIYSAEGNDSTDGWKVFLEQEKHPFRTGAEQTEAPVVICEGDVPDWLGSYMEKGGYALVSGVSPRQLPFETDYRGMAVLEKALLFDNANSSTRIASAVSIFAGEGNGQICLHEKRIIKSGMHPDEFPAFLYQTVGRGGCWYTGISISGLISMQGDILRKIDGFSEITERITAIDKHLIFDAMKYYIHDLWARTGLPYFFLGYYPKGYDNMFSFRVDGDGIFGNLKKLSAAAAKSQIPVTFFVNRELCESEKEEILEAQEELCIGNHGVVHNLMGDYKGSYENISSCEEWMASVGIKAGAGFVAPRGMWNYELSDALKDLGYSYTSDFGYCIYGLPFYPYYQGKRRGVKQIPVAPFSCERASVQFSEQGWGELTPGYVAKYFEKLMDLQYQKGMPSILYSHPEVFGSMSEEIFPRIREKLNTMNTWVTTLPEISRWWDERDQTVFEVEFDEGTGEARIRGQIPDRVGVFNKPGR